MPMHELRKGERRAHAILLEEPSHGVKGIVACAVPGCNAVQVLLCRHKDAEDCTDKHGEEMTQFITGHNCGPGPN